LANVGDGQLELVVGPDQLALYPFDARLQPVAIGDAQALLLGEDGKTLPLTAATDHWETGNPFGTDKAVTLVAVLRRASGSTAARFELHPGQGSMFHDHRPFHGGLVGMAGERHLELAIAPTGAGAELQLYLTDAYRQPAPLDGIHGTLTIQEKGRDVTLPLIPAGDCFTAEVAGTSASGAFGNVHVHLAYPSAPNEVDMDFYLEQTATVDNGKLPVEVRVGSSGFAPNRIEVAAGQALTLRFFRTTDDTCAKQVVFPSMGLERDLPLRRDVDVALVPTRSEIAFSCGSGMFKGAVIGR
jgi:hypothetical protein